MTPRNQFDLSALQESGHEDQLFVHDVLGLLPDEDAARLDERSVTEIRENPSGPW